MFNTDKVIQKKKTAQKFPPGAKEREVVYIPILT